MMLLYRARQQYRAFASTPRPALQGCGVLCSIPAIVTGITYPGRRLPFPVLMSFVR